jgi:hypothetical protein
MSGPAPATPPAPGSPAAQEQGGGQMMEDILGMALPMIAQMAMGGGGGGLGALMGGRFGRRGFRGGRFGGRGGRFGGSRMVPGFRGGMLRPGYYPHEGGGMRFHGGGYHPGWRPHWQHGGGFQGEGGGGAQNQGYQGASNPYQAQGGQGGQGGQDGQGGGGDGASGLGGYDAQGNPTPGGGYNQDGSIAGGTGTGQAGLGSRATSNGNQFWDALMNAESQGINQYSRVDPDRAGPNSRSQGYFQIQTPTWQRYAREAGVDLNRYPNAMSAPQNIQAAVASRIPLAQFGQRTRDMLARQFGRLNGAETIGQLAGRFGGSGGGGTRVAAGSGGGQVYSSPQAGDQAWAAAKQLGGVSD